MSFHAPRWGAAIRFLASGAGVGFLPVAPGTWGSALGLGLGVALLSQGMAPQTLLLLTLAGVPATIWLCEEAAKAAPHALPDPAWIVLDEIVAQMLLVAMCPLIGWDPTHWCDALCAFAAFRLCDIVKPFPVSWAESFFSGGCSIVLDDVFAAVWALGLLWVGEKLSTYADWGALCHG